MSRTIALTGSTGMLGKAVIEKATALGVEVLSFYSDPNELLTYDKRPDYLINCAGAIPIRQPSMSRVIEANSLLPVILAEYCQKNDIKMLHVSTDCVFSGRSHIQSYTVSDVPDATDIYGLSKALGEKCSALGAIVVRTSFVGLDHGLLPWFLGEQKTGRKIPGWGNAFWSGSTVWEVASGLLEMIDEDFEKGRIVHLATERPMNKYDVLREFASIFDLKVDIDYKLAPFINHGLHPTKKIRSIKHPEVADELRRRA